MKADVIKKFFQSWIDKDIEIVKQTFSENALYSECYGPEYHGLSQIVTWFEDWHNKGNQSLPQSQQNKQHSVRAYRKQIYALYFYVKEQRIWQEFGRFKYNIKNIH